MRYEEHPPPPAVAPCVACLWTLTGAVRTPSFDLILPDGRPELVVHRGDPFRRRRASGSTRLQPRRLVVGQMTGGVALAPGRRVESVGVRFTPAGLAPLCPFPQAELADRIVDVDAAAGAAPAHAGRCRRPRPDAGGGAGDAATGNCRVSMPRRRQLDPRLVRAVTRITTSAARCSMDALTPRHRRVVAVARAALPERRSGSARSGWPAWCDSGGPWPRSTPTRHGRRRPRPRPRVLRPGALHRRVPSVRRRRAAALRRAPAGRVDPVLRRSPATP